MARFSVKKVKQTKPLAFVKEKVNILSQETKDNVVLQENKEDKKVNDMTTSEKIEQVNAIVAPEVTPKFKRTRRDRGLIERTESSTIILTEDNKELLQD